MDGIHPGVLRDSQRSLATTPVVVFLLRRCGVPDGTASVLISRFDPAHLLLAASSVYHDHITGKIRNYGRLPSLVRARLLHDAANIDNAIDPLARRLAEPLIAEKLTRDIANRAGQSNELRTHQEHSGAIAFLDYGECLRSARAADQRSQAFARSVRHGGKRGIGKKPSCPLSDGVGDGANEGGPHDAA